LLTVWECETFDSDALKKRVKRFLDGPPTQQSHT
jgi:hypothetical protein